MRHPGRVALPRAERATWLEHWDPEDAQTWDRGLAWRTLSISTLTLMLGFATWFLTSAIAPKLENLGFDLSDQQLYWLVAVPGLAGGIFRLMWMVLPPILGTRLLVTVTSLLLLVPVLGWAAAVQDPTTSYPELLLLAFLTGIGGGAFSGLMPSTSYFFPRRLQGTALGLQAGLANVGVPMVQLLTPWVVGFSLLGLAGGSQLIRGAPNAPPREVWYQSAALVYVPFLVLAAVLAWSMLRSVPVHADLRQQLDIFRNQDTWWMTAFYLMTFGVFAGLASQFALLMKNLYGLGNPDIVQGTGRAAQLLVEGYVVPDPADYVFLGPLVGAGARALFSPLTDRFGGARWTLVAAVGLAISIAVTLPALEPDTSSAAALEAGFERFLGGSLAIFLFAGMGGASTFKQMPMIFERRTAGEVMGWVAAMAAFGPFLFGVGLAAVPVTTFYAGLLVLALGCATLTWVRYARPGAPRPG